MAAANTDKLRKKKSNFSTTLSSSISAVATSMSLASASGLPSDTGITLTINRVDANGSSTPSKTERVTGTYSGSGNSIANLVRGEDGGSGKAHDSGAVVEDIWDADTWNDACSAFLEEHNQDGTHKKVTGLTNNTAITQKDSGGTARSIANINGSDVLTLGNTTTTTKIHGGSSNTNGHTVPNAADDTVTLNAATQTLTNKTLTSPVINVGSDAQGDIYYRNGSGIFTRLAPGTNGHFLKTQGAGANPTWAAAGASTQTRSFFKSAYEFYPVLGSPALADTDDTTPYYVMTDSADLGVGITIGVPADYSSGNISIYVCWASLSTNSGNIRWSVRRTGPMAEDENILGATVNDNFTEAAIATTNDLNISAERTISSAAANDLIALSVRRLGSDGADTLSGNIGFLGIIVQYTSAQ